MTKEDKVVLAELAKMIGGSEFVVIVFQPGDEVVVHRAQAEGFESGLKTPEDFIKWSEEVKALKKEKKVLETKCTKLKNSLDNYKKAVKKIKKEDLG